MRIIFAHLLGVTALCTAVAAAAPTQMSARGWLSRVPALPATAESAYAQWNDVSGVLTPNSASQQVTGGIEAELLTLARVVELPPGHAGRLSSHDQALAAKIDVFGDTGGVLQKVRAAQTEQAAALQQGTAELNSLEQRRLGAGE